MKDCRARTSVILLISLFIGCCLAASMAASSQDDKTLATVDGMIFNFIAYGDTRGSGTDSVSPLHSTIVDTYLKHQPEFIMHTGDMVYHGGEWHEWLEFNESIAAIWDTGTPFYGAVGNHELYTDTYGVNDDDLSNYTAFFDFSGVAEQSNGTELYYSFDYGGVHFVILNTEDHFENHAFNPSPEQTAWLAQDLAKVKPDDSVVVAFHRPAYSILEGRSDRWAEADTIRNALHNLFVQNGVDLVFTGHDHYYYRTIRDNIYYVTVAGGGAPLYTPDKTAPTWQDGDVTYSEYHYCNVEVNLSHISVTALTLNGSTIDTFSIRRTATPTTTTTTTTTRVTTTRPTTTMPATTSTIPTTTTTAAAAPLPLTVATLSIALVATAILRRRKT